VRHLLSSGSEADQGWRCGDMHMCHGGGSGPRCSTSGCGWSRCDKTEDMSRRPRWPWRRPAIPPEDRLYLPSLDLLTHIAMQERDKQLAHFDALDTKAGVLMAFDGVLIVVSRGVRLAFQLPGVVLAAASAAMGLAAFWPRKFPTLDLL
jgi:hypothetical protein